MSEKLFSEGIPSLSVVSTQEYESVKNALSNFITHVLLIEPGQPFYIINRGSNDIANAAYEAAIENRYGVRCFNINHDKPLTEFPPELKNFIKSSPPKAMMTLFDYSRYGSKFQQDEQSARIELVGELVPTLPTVCSHSPGITWEMAVNGPIQVDYAQMARHSDLMLKSLIGARKIRVTNDSGTDLVIDVPKSLEWQTDCFYRRKNNKFSYGRLGVFGNLPVGEVFGIFPFGSGKIGEINIKDKIPVTVPCDGHFVCDMSNSISETVAKDPSQFLEYFIEKGVVTRIECEDKGYLDKVLNVYKGSTYPVVVEEVLGTGFNKKARITGDNFLEDEKALRTGHMAFSTVILHKGGRVEHVHGDHLTREPTYEVTYADGRKQVIMDKGKLLV